jgi:NAD(P)-dependent dehydrogenase (short-subunit alcohol dehydrogenase family)
MKGKNVLVTGGASGMGRETALELARRGVNVAIADRKIAEAEEAAKECAALGVKAEAIEFNQTNPTSVQACVAQAVEKLGSLELLFANAGAGRFKPFIEMTPDEWRFMIDVNLNGTFYVCNAAAKAIIKGGRGGAIVLTSSCGAEVVCDHLSAYCSAKSGIVMLMKHMASELGPYRIRANAIMPGVIETQLSSYMLSEQTWRDMLARETPVGRWGQPIEIAKVVSFLLSDDASFVNGEAVMVDGGSTLHGYPRWYTLDYRRENHQDWKQG